MSFEAPTTPGGALGVPAHPADILRCEVAGSCSSFSLGAFDQHAAVDCHDEGGDLQELRTPAAGDRYFLVVPHNLEVEGSYGRRAGGVERAQGTEACAPIQIITDCPS